MAPAKAPQWFGRLLMYNKQQAPKPRFRSPERMDNAGYTITRSIHEKRVSI
jgi:hypothetical protein